MPKKNNPGCRCCCSQVLGFDIGDSLDVGFFLNSGIANTVTCCKGWSGPVLGGFYDGYQYIDDLATNNIDRLDECDNIFAGGWGCVTGAQVLFQPDDYHLVAEWLQSGGKRLYVGSEFRTKPSVVNCAEDVNVQYNNTFLSSIGSSMQFASRVGHCCGGCACLAEKVGNYKINENVDILHYAASDEVTGGTPLWKIIIPEDVSPLLECESVEPYVFCALEKITTEGEDSYIMAVGDSNVLNGCSSAAPGWESDNCKFWNNWFKVDDLLGEVEE